MLNNVRFEGIEKRFDGVTALRNFELEAPDKKFLALLGPSGCGKTTALRILAGLENPSAGNVYIGARQVTRLQPRDRDIAMVFQSYALYPHMTVRENVAYPLWLRDVSETERKGTVETVAKSLEIDHLLDRRPRQLSGGQRQRVALARAIVRNPAAFLMDEPLSNLDARLRLAMRGEIKKLCQRIGATTIYVTHDQAEAMTMADLIAVMGQGSLEQVAPPDTVYDEPANRYVATFVGNPPMNVFKIEPNGRELVTGGGPLAVESGLVSLISQCRAVEMGVRPEDIRLVEPGTSGAIVGEVYVVEPMGSETLVDVRIGSERLIARGERGFRASVGSKVGAGFDIRDATFFDVAGVAVVHRAKTKGGKKA